MRILHDKLGGRFGFFAYLKQKYGKHVTLKNRTSDIIATNPYLNKLYLTVFPNYQIQEEMVKNGN